jgi:hypothetical protein
MLFNLLALASLSFPTLAIDVSIFTDDYFFPVVSDGETIKHFDETQHTHVEDQFQSLTKFDIDVMEGESFSPPIVSIVGVKTPQDALFPEDDVLGVELDGDSLFVDLYREEDEEYAFELAVLYKCYKDGKRDIRVTIPFSQVDQLDDFFYEANVTITWTKVCVANKPRVGLSIVTESNDPVVIDGGVTEGWDPASPSVLIGLHEDTSRFFIGVSDGSQTYSKPTVVVSEPFLKVDLRGDASTSNIIEFDEYNTYDDGGQFQMLEAIFTCLTTGIADVTITYELAPFLPVSFAFKKNCGGSAPTGFDVSTSGVLGAEADVVTDAVALEAWNPETHTAVVPISEASSIFWVRLSSSTDPVSTSISSSGGGTPLVANRVIATVSPSIFRPTIISELDNGGTISTAPKQLEVVYNCRKKGTAEVVVTIVLPRSQMVEWAWEKECGARIIAREGNVWTADQMLTLFSMSAVTIIGLIVFTWLRYKKQVTEKERARLAALREQEEEVDFE